MALPRTTERPELIRKFRALGWVGPFSGGNHAFMRKGTHTVRVPNQHGDSDTHVSLLKKILEQASITEADWLNA